MTQRRPSFGPETPAEEPRKQGGFGLFGRKRPAERSESRREDERAHEPAADPDLDEELEIPAFLRRQMTQR